MLRLTWLFSATVRNNTAANGRYILGADATPAELTRYGRTCLHSFYDFVVDLAHARTRSRTQIEARIASTTGLDSYPNKAERNHGVVLATAHYGSFEVGLVDIMRAEGRATVLFQHDPTPFGALRQTLHRQIGVQECLVDGGLEAWDTLRRELEAGHAVIIQGDRCMPGQRGAVRPFLHGQIEAPLGPARLAQISGCPLVPVLATRQKTGHVHLALGPPIHPDPDGGRKEEALRLTDHVLAFFAQGIRQDPAQWHVLHQAFEKSPLITDTEHCPLNSC